MTDDCDFRSLLRDLPVLTGKSPTFDFAAAPSDPVTLFRAWLRQAVDDGVLEPHAMTLSTVDDAGAPDARALIVKDVDEAGWHFAVIAVSPTGAQLSARPQAALTFYWPLQVRQVRVRGSVVADGEDIRRADFEARSTGSRAMALTLRQSQPFSATDELDSALEQTARADQSLTGLRRSIRRAVIALDPATAEQKAEAARADRHVRLVETDHGKAWLYALLPAADA